MGPSPFPSFTSPSSPTPPPAPCWLLNPLKAVLEVTLEFHPLCSHCSFNSNLHCFSFDYRNSILSGPCTPSLLCPSVLPSATYFLCSPNLLTIYFNQDPSWLPTALRKIIKLFSFIHNTWWFLFLSPFTYLITNVILTHILQL